MKKYVKPELFYERFELTQHIAVCAFDMNNLNKESCQGTADATLVPDLDGLKLFMDSGKGCTLNPGNYDAYCYHGNVNTANAFNS